MENIVSVLKKQGVSNTGLLFDVLEKTKVIDKPMRKTLISIHSEEGQFDESSFKDIIKSVSAKKHTKVRNVLNSLSQIITTKSFAALVETLHSSATLKGKTKHSSHKSHKRKEESDESEADEKESNASGTDEKAEDEEEDTGEDDEEESGSD